MTPTLTMLRSFGPRGLAPLVLLVLLSAATSGCRDVAGGDPLAVVLTEQTRGALSVDLDLPSLPGIVAGGDAAIDVAVPGSADEWTGRWESSWLMEPARGREVRQAVYDEAMHPLARGLGPDGVRSVLTSVEEATDAASSAELIELPPLYRARVEEARELVAWGHGALDDGATADALRAALEASDRMRTVSPESVAQVLLARARGGVGDLSDRPEQESERIGRLVRGAEAALEEGDYQRAIHRAFYACQLLDVGLP